jgi:PAS domain S-box-containing protein
VLAWDDQMYALYGLKKEEFSGAYEAWINGLHPEERNFCQNEVRLALLGEKEYNIEFRLVWPDGTIHYTKAKGEVFRDEKGVPVRMVGINYDITEQKKIDKKIREKDLEFRKLSANVPDLIFQFTRRPDGSYYVPVASEGIRNIFGCTPEEVLDDFTPIGRVIYPEDAERVIRDIEYSAEHLTYFTCEFRVQIPGREIQWIYSKSTPERLPDASITWYGFNADITQLKQTEEKIKKLNDELEFRVNERTSQLEAANKELEAFSYSVSHDLRAPLRHINGFAEILTKKYSDQLSDDARKHLNTITSSAKRMGTLIDDLLSFSRTGRAEMKKSTLNMNQVIEDALVQIKPLLTDRKIEWKISSLPEANGDYNLLRLVWINLLDNAVKYTQSREIAVIQIGYNDEKRETVFFIKDNGAGFDMKYADKLFGVFQRLHSSSQFDGTGIGLANVHRIILRHGGRTWAEAETDKGATFYFSIPK